MNKIIIDKEHLDSLNKVILNLKSQVFQLEKINKELKEKCQKNHS